MSEHLHRASASPKMIAVVTIDTVLALVGTSNANAGTYVINDCPSAPTGPDHAQELQRSAGFANANLTRGLTSKQTSAKIPLEVAGN